MKSPSTAQLLDSSRHARGLQILQLWAYPSSPVIHFNWFIEYYKWIALGSFWGGCTTSHVVQERNDVHMICAVRVE